MVCIILAAEFKIPNGRLVAAEGNIADPKATAIGILIDEENTSAVTIMQIRDKRCSKILLV